jgi:hypothetical protein
MDAFRFHSLSKHWQDHPPVHITVAAYVYGRRRDASSTPAAQLELPAAQSAGAILDSLIGEDDHAR